MPSFILFSLLTVAQAHRPSLVAGSVPGRVEDSDPIVDAPGIHRMQAGVAVLGDAYLLSVEPGTWTLEMTSIDFDTFLVVLDATGEVVGEDDDGLFRTDSRLVFELPAGAEYVVHACALHSQRGEYELRLVAGRAPELPIADRERLAEAQNAARAARVSRSATEFGEESVEHADALYAWARASAHGGDREKAVNLLTRAIAVFEHTGEQGRLVTAANEIAVCFGNLNRWSEALEWAQRAYDLSANDPAHSPISVALLAFNLGFACLKTQEYSSAVEAFEQSVQHYADIGGSAAEGAQRARDKLAFALRNAGEWPRFLESVSETRTLIIGEAIAGRFDWQGFDQHTDMLIKGYSKGPAHTVARRVRIQESGWYTIEMRSFYLDAYLVLRNLDGTILAQDDDGLLPGVTDAQMTVELDARREYLLEATALHGGTGKYSLRALRGRADDRSLADDAELLNEHLLASLRCVEEWDGPEDGAFVGFLNHLGLRFFAAGQLTEALRLQRRALPIRERIWGRNSLGYIFGLGEMAHVLTLLDRPIEALPLAERALRISRSVSGVESLEVARRERKLATILIKLRDYERADFLLGHAVGVYDALLDPHDLTQREVLLVLSELQFAQKNYELAIRTCERMLAIARLPYGGTRGPNYLVASSLSRLASGHEALGDFDQARSLIEEAIELYVAEAGLDSLRVAASRRVLARIVTAQGDYAAALELWHGAHATILAIAGLQGRGMWMANSLQQGAYLRFQLGDQNLAIEQAWDALEIGARLEGRILAAVPESHRMRRLDKGRWALALLLNATLDAPATGNDPYLQTLRWKGRVSRSLVESRQRALHDMDDDARAKVVALRDVQATLSASYFESRGASSRFDPAQLAELRARRVELEIALLESSGEERASVIESVAQLSAALPSDTVLVDFLAYPHCVPAQRNDMGEVTTPGGWSDDEQLVAFVMRPGDDNARRVNLGKSAVVDAALREFLDAVVGEGGVDGRGVGLVEDAGQGAAFARANQRLRTLLWDPLIEHVTDAQRVIISPFGSLGTLPFEALQRADGTHLIEHHAFVYLQDATALLELDSERSASAARGLVVVGGVDYDATTDDAPGPGVQEYDGLLALADRNLLRGGQRDSWPLLRFTDQEAREVTQLYRTATDEHVQALHLAGGAATEQRVKRTLAGQRFVHIATHGFFHHENVTSMWEAAQVQAGNDQGMEAEATELSGLFPGLLSGLVFAGANLDPQPGRDDGLLTAEEVTWIDLAGCELVTLSACQTALGTARGGEGLVGLRRSFRLAGARTVVASLWSVGDESTAELMRSFYRRLWHEGRSKGTALRQAQLEMLRKNRAEHHGRTMPWTWGAFVLSGDWK